MLSRIRHEGVRANYPAEGVHHDGAIYPGMYLTRYTGEVEPAASTYLASVLGADSIEYSASFFRCMTEGMDTAHGHDFRVHYDSTFGECAFVLYLSAPGTEVGGTAFWRHKSLGDNSLTPDNSMRINQDLTRRSAWEIESLVGMRYGRGVLYPANMIHSAYPQEGWGDGPANARLIWTALFTPSYSAGAMPRC
jgi:hypothetical protein